METQDKKETQLRSLAEIIATAGRNCEFLLELNKVSIYKITCNSNEAINENYKNFKWSLLTDPVSPFQIIWFSAFRHRWATITALWTDPPPTYVSFGDICARTRQHCTHRCHNLCGARPIKGEWTTPDHLFSGSPLLLDPPGSWQPGQDTVLQLASRVHYSEAWAWHHQRRGL